MKKALLVIAAVAASATVYAQKVDTVVVVNPGKVIVTKSDSLQTVEIIGKNNDEEYKYMSSISLGKNPSTVTSITNKLEFDTFLSKYADKKVPPKKAVTQVMILSGLGLGWGGTIDRDPGVGYHAMFLGDFYVPIVFGVKYKSAGGMFEFSTGVGYNRRTIRASGKGGYWEKENGNLMTKQLPDDCKLKHSRLYVRSITAPVYFTFKIGKDKDRFTIGPEFIYNYRASAVTRYYVPGGDRVKHKITGLKPNRFCVGLFVSTDWTGIPIYFRWQPANIFDGVKGPKMGFYSFGIML